MTLMFAAGILALLVATGFFVWLMILAFKESAGWGLAVLFLPFAFIFFAIKHWDGARKPFLGYMGTTVAGLMLLFASGIMAGMKAGAMMEEEMLAAMQQAEQEGFDFDEPAGNEEADLRPTDGADATMAERPSIAVESSDELQVPARRPDALVEALPARRLNKLPPDGRIQPARANRYVGERMRVSSRYGLDVVGTLKSAKGDRLVFEKELGGGMASFELSRAEIDKLVVLRR